MDNVESDYWRANLNWEVGGGDVDFEVESTLNENIVGTDDLDMIYTPQVAPDLKPNLRQKFKIVEDAYEFYNAYAKASGFSIRNYTEKKSRVSGEIQRKEFVCWKQGKGTILANERSSRRRGSIKENCKARLVVVRSTSGLCVVSIFDESHSHPLSTPRKAQFLPSHRTVSTAQKALTQQLRMVNVPTHQQYNLLEVQAGGFENIGCTQKDLYNYERDRRNEMKGHDGDMLHEFFKLEQGKNPSFYFKIEADDENKITHAFWADANSRRAYNFYGDVVVFDTTFNTNRYEMIFAPLLGVNNHGQTIIFSCAFLSDETIDSFVWLFNQFLGAMPGDAPKMIITDQDPAMANAIAQALPNTFHRYCSWHILTKFSEKLDSVKYSAYYKEFAKCIWGSEIKEEFDLKWMELVEKSGLNDNKWLQLMYQIRSKWVPAFVNHVFSANMSSSQRAESSHSFFKKYVSKNNFLVDFMIQFGRGIVRQRHEELLADHKDMVEKPKMKIIHEFLVHMIDIYTREKFFEFQDELCESFTYKFELLKEDDFFRVYKVERKLVQHNSLQHIFYDKVLDFASCTCKKFESSGIPCKHLIGYLHKMHDYEKLPDQYILSRWTKTAKFGVIIDGNGAEITDDRSYLLKQSHLIQLALDVVDMALTSEEATQVYTDALSGVSDKIRAMGIGCGNNIVHVVDRSQIPRAVASGNMSNNYNEPSQVRAKGCGKRLKGGKEKALGRAQNIKSRRCHGCGSAGQSHDKRNCPVLTNRYSSHHDDPTQEPSVDDDSYSSTGLSL